METKKPCPTAENYVDTLQSTVSELVTELFHLLGRVPSLWVLILTERVLDTGIIILVQATTKAIKRLVGPHPRCFDMDHSHVMLLKRLFEASWTICLMIFCRDLPASIENSPSHSFHCACREGQASEIWHIDCDQMATPGDQ